METGGVRGNKPLGLGEAHSHPFPSSVTTLTANNMASYTHPSILPTRSCSIREHYDGGLILIDDPEKGYASACVRAVERLANASTWRTLSRVKELHIEDAEDALTELPAEVAGLKELRVLGIRWSAVRFLPMEMINMELTQLHLANNKIQDIEPVNRISSLIVLDLAFNMIEALPDTLKRLSYLRELNLSGNKLKVLPDSICDLRQLSELILASNTLVSLPNGLCGLTELRTLDVSGNRLSFLPENIGSLSSLVTLIASSNILTNLPRSISDLRELRWLMLRQNQFTEVPAVVALLPKLEVLNMRMNYISAMSVSLEQLKHLLLDFNEVEDISESMLGCQNLETLSLERNSIKKLPCDISRLCSLRALYLRGNMLSELPQDMGDLLQLRHLDLQDNAIDHLPSRFTSLRRLSMINLDNTNINGAWMSAYRQGVTALLDYAIQSTKIPPVAARNGLVLPNGSGGNLAEGSQIGERHSKASQSSLKSSLMGSLLRRKKPSSKKAERPSSEVIEKRVSATAKCVEEITVSKRSTMPLNIDSNLSSETVDLNIDD